MRQRARRWVVGTLMALMTVAAVGLAPSQQLGPGRSDEDVLAHNESVTRANVVVWVHDVALRRLDEQLNELLGVDLPVV